MSETETATTVNTVNAVNTIIKKSGPEIIKTPVINDKGPPLWNFFNALAFLILIIVIFIFSMLGITQFASIAEIKKNWKKHRCNPSIMPFASIYGYNTSENFNYCMGNIFNVHSADITGSFTTIISKFTGILSILMGSINSLRTALATLGGGINVVFQDFKDRITTFFFKIRLSSIRVKLLMQRMYATMFSVMYMGLSGITSVSNFSHTALFGFLDTFCFTPDTRIKIEITTGDKVQEVTIPIAKVRIGDILLPGRARVTSKFHFNAPGQPMVKIGDGQSAIQVSSNHYMLHEGKWIRSEEHPDATQIGPYTGNSLICLNTDTHEIPMGPYRFRDYDETEEGGVDTLTMRYIENRINSRNEDIKQKYPFDEYFPSLEKGVEVLLEDGNVTTMEAISVGTKLSTGCTVIGKVQREISEYCVIDSYGIKGPIITSSATLIWYKQKWVRAGEIYKIHKSTINPVFISLFVSPSSIIELASGHIVRDSIELCSPDAETYYSQQLKQLNT